MKRLFILALIGVMAIGAQAQRVTDRLDRGVVAVPGKNGGMHVSWRKFGSEYYDTQYNLYRNGTKVAGPISLSNYEDAAGSSSSKYAVEAIVRGVAQGVSPEVKAWSNIYKTVAVPAAIGRNGSNVTSHYHNNDISLGDVNGDGIAEFLLKRPSDVAGNQGERNSFHHYECITIDGERLWWIDMGPNMLSGPDEQWDMIAYDWDQDGKAECILRGADNMIIHTATGKEINIGNMNYTAPRDEYTHQGAEYLLYLNGETGEPYGWDGADNFTPMAYPLPRFEQGESDYAAVWGSNDTGHRSSKHYFGAPYLDGRNPSIFLGRGCYTRHKACALDVDPLTHQLIQRWRWNCYEGGSPWFGNGFHNFAIADVDMDGRDEIVYGSMILDDNGYGLCSTGLGHGDAQHCGDLDPYRWGLEQFVCLEGSQGNAYWNAATGDIYYRKSDGGDDGRAMAGNFTDDVPGGQARSVSSGIIGLSSDKIVYTDGNAYLAWGDLNMRIYWDGDLCDELLNSPGTGRVLKITKWGNGRILTSPTGQLNNSSKNNPCVQGDILGDWREEVVVRDGEQLHVYTTDYATEYDIYTLWHDHEYRNGMAWQCIGYNQPPHTSFFLGQRENITIAPPPLILEGREEVGSSIGTTDSHLLVSGYEDKTISVDDGAAPYLLTVNAPAWYQGTGDQQATRNTPKQPTPNIIYYTTTLTGGAFSGAMRLVKQGEGRLVLPNVVEKYTGETNVWNGTLLFDGTMEASPVWLNRHTTLISDGGKFMGGLKADYNATIYPGGDGKTGSITASELTLGFGSRVVFDATADATDQLNAAKLTIETKSWQNGPKYKTPIFEFRNAATLTDGEHLLGEVGEMSGSVSDILVEGISDKRFELKHTDGKLYLVIGSTREATTVVWNGKQGSNIWDLAQSKNFLNNGEEDYAVIGDDIVFDDNAESGTVLIKGAVRPNSITFNNETLSYVLNGDSILGGGTIIKNGAGRLTINTENRTGETTINGGKVNVKALANKTGVTYGALGDVNQKININDGATLAFVAPVITDQQVNVSGEATIEVASNCAVTFNKGFRGSGATVVKTGSGSLTTGTGGNYSKLIIKQGTVNCSQSGNVDQLPQTVEFQGGELWGTTMDDTPGRTTNANFVVPEGKTGTYYGPYRGVNNGKLTGSGTFKFFSGGVRCYWDGDWSQFEGTLEPGTRQRQAKPAYDPSMDFRSAKGLPKATLKLNDGVVFNSTNDIQVGKVTGTGTLAGGKRYILVGDDDQIATFKSTSPITKRGEGYLRLTAVGNINATMTVENGELQINDTQMKNPFFGSTGTVTVKSKGQLIARALLAALTVQNGGQVTPRSFLNEYTPGTIKVSGNTTFAQGTTLHVVIKDAGDYSKLDLARFTMNGTVAVTLAEDYTPKAGDTFSLWTATNFTGTPTFELPELPEGLYWNTDGMADKNGVLAITDDLALGIGRLGDDAVVTCDVYNAGGRSVGRFTAPRRDIRSEVRKLGVLPGLYIVKMQGGRNFDAETVILK